jgi:hypothetical protein
VEQQTISQKLVQSVVKKEMMLTIKLQMGEFTKKLTIKFTIKGERKKMKTRDEICKDIDYLFSKINWGTSFLDAEAIQIMNSLKTDIRSLE